jgi:hypothetical protein
MPMGVVMFNTLPIFALRLGATVNQVGMVYALIWITDLLQYLLGPELARSQKKHWMTVFYTGACISFTGVFVIPLLPILHLSQLSLLVLLVAIGLYNAFTSLALAGYSAYIQKTFSLNITGQLLGKVQATGGLTWLVSALGVSLLLGNKPPIWRYYLIFIFAQLFVLARVALTAYGLLADPRPQNTVFSKRTLALLAPLKSKSMFFYSLIAITLSLLISLPIPLFPSYFNNNLHVSEAFNVLILSAPYTAALFFGRSIGRKADAVNFHWLAAIAMGVISVSMVGIVHLAKIADPVLVGILGLVVVTIFGLGYSIVLIILSRERFARAPTGFESESLGLGNAAIGIGAAAGSLLGGSLPEIVQNIIGRWGYSEVFYLLASVFLCTFILLCLPRLNLIKTFRK